VELIPEGPRFKSGPRNKVDEEVTTHVVTSLVLRPKGGSPGVRTEFLRRVLTLGAETAWSHHIAPAAL
jgi:hypothetical protein